MILSNERAALSAVSLAFVLAACAQPPVARTPALPASAVATTDPVGEAAPITVQTYVSHPTILAIRKQVREIDALTLTKSENPGCDGTNTKWTDASGVIRHLRLAGGEGESEGSTDVWYGANGKALFAYHREVDYRDESPRAKGSATASEQRTYFDASGQPIFDVARDGEVEHRDAPLPQALDRSPEDRRKVTSESVASPEKQYAQTGCGAP